MPTVWIGQRKGKGFTRLQLFCFSGGGYDRSLFDSWETLMPDEIALCPVELPEPAANDVDVPDVSFLPLVERTMHDLLPALDAPFAFFGYCTGTLFAFEVARLLYRRHGLAPQLLAVAGWPAPHRVHLDELTGHTLLAGSNLAQGNLLLTVSPQKLQHNLTLAGAYDYLPSRALPCPIRAFGGDCDPGVPVAALDAWRYHTASDFTVRVLPGDHFFVPSVTQELVTYLTADLLALSAVSAQLHKAA